MLTEAGYGVSWVDWRNNSMPRCDIAIFLELWNPRLLHYADKTIGIFNIEWFQRQWAIGLHACTQLWTKSAEAQEIFTRHLGLRKSVYTGFMSRDLHDPTVPRELTAVHLRGKSTLKGTQLVLEAWANNPDLPPLTVISNEPLPVPPWVRLFSRIDDTQLKRELNRAQIHMCPSSTEGWGHYIVEGMSVGGVVITTNASPMNEHITPDTGVLLPPVRRSRHGLATAWHVDSVRLTKAVRTVAEMSPEQRASMGARSCARFHARNDAFRTKALQLLETL